MTQQELNKQAEQLFVQYPKENMFYCIDNGIFWFEQDNKSALHYANKLSMPLIKINRKVENTIIESVEVNTKSDDIITTDFKIPTVVNNNKNGKNNKKLK